MRERTHIYIYTSNAHFKPERTCRFIDLRSQRSVRCDSRSTVSLKRVDWVIYCGIDLTRFTNNTSRVVVFSQATRLPWLRSRHSLSISLLHDTRGECSALSAVKGVCRHQGLGARLRDIIGIGSRHHSLCSSFT